MRNFFTVLYHFLTPISLIIHELMNNLWVYRVNQNPSLNVRRIHKNASILLIFFFKCIRISLATRSDSLFYKEITGTPFNWAITIIVLSPGFSTFSGVWSVWNKNLDFPWNRHENRMWLEWFGCNYFLFFYGELKREVRTASAPRCQRGRFLSS